MIGLFKRRLVSNVLVAFAWTLVAALCLYASSVPIVHGEPLLAPGVSGPFFPVSPVGRWKVTVWADGGPYRGYLIVSEMVGPNVYAGTMTLSWGGRRHGLTGHYSISIAVNGTSVRMKSTNVSFAPPLYDGWFSPTTYTLTTTGQAMAGIVRDHNQCDGRQRLTVCRVTMARD